jgi:hypothetical protein
VINLSQLVGLYATNHTGFRLITALDGYQNQPERLDYPGHLGLGVDQAGREVIKPWAKVGHAARHHRRCVG